MLSELDESDQELLEIGRENAGVVDNEFAGVQEIDDQNNEEINSGDDSDWEERERENNLAVNNRETRVRNPTKKLTYDELGVPSTVELDANNVVVEVETACGSQSVDTQAHGAHVVSDASFVPAGKYASDAVSTADGNVSVSVVSYPCLSSVSVDGYSTDGNAPGYSNWYNAPANNANWVDSYGQMNQQVYAYHSTDGNVSQINPSLFYVPVNNLYDGHTDYTNRQSYVAPNSLLVPSTFPVGCYPSTDRNGLAQNQQYAVDRNSGLSYVVDKPYAYGQSFAVNGPGVINQQSTDVNATDRDMTNRQPVNFCELPNAHMVPPSSASYYVQDVMNNQYQCNQWYC